MASASAGLELPATSLIAPLLGRIAVSWREAPLPRALITRSRQGWQYDGQAGPGFVPVDSGDSGFGPRTRCAPLPNLTPACWGLVTPEICRKRTSPQPAGEGVEGSLCEAMLVHHAPSPSPTLARKGAGADRTAHADSRNRR